MQINWDVMSVPAECQQNFHLPQHMKEVSDMYTYFSYSATNCTKFESHFTCFLEYDSTFYYVKSPAHMSNVYLNIVQR